MRYLGISFYVQNGEVGLRLLDFLEVFDDVVNSLIQRK